MQERYDRSRVAARAVVAFGAAHFLIVLVHQVTDRHSSATREAESGLVSLRPRVKICGVVAPEDAASIAFLGVDYIGLNFITRSRRFLPEDRAAAVRDRCGAARVVGLFDTVSIDEVARTAKNLDLAAVQIYGPIGVRHEELARLTEALDAVGKTSIWLPLPSGNRSVDAFVRQMETSGGKVDAVIADAPTEDGLGGTGKTWDWLSLSRTDVSTRLILAGGLTVANVAAAIAAVRPFAVDVASGVESSPGKKNMAVVEQFVKAAGG